MNGNSKVINQIRGESLEVAENLTLVLKESQGKQTSVIVPVDFVTAGGDSADCCPTWRWPTEGELNMKAYLPVGSNLL
uniref:Uncharacterized protein n=1 Tax=Neovison vison TaxID=452646 RepID=A0A8C7AZG9_NEOVI